MPRLPTRLLWRAHIKNPLNPLLLQKCRTCRLGYEDELRCVHNELMWLNELAKMTLRTKLGDCEGVPEPVKKRCVAKLVKTMGRGQPLPLVMDSKPFGDLNIECPKGALSPQYVELCIKLKTGEGRRTNLMLNTSQCTEASTKHLARLVKTEMRDYEKKVTPIRTPDLCSGTRCIPLLLLSLLPKALPNMQFKIVGVDVSPTELALEQRNHTRDLFQYPDTSRRRQLRSR